MSVNVSRSILWSVGLALAASGVSTIAQTGQPTPPAGQQPATPAATAPAPQTPAPLTPVQRQPDLFADADTERQRRLAECKDAIRQRFGFMAVTAGSALVVAEQLDHDRDNFRLRTPCLTR